MMNVCPGVNFLALKPHAVDQFRRHEIILPKVYCGAHQLLSTNSQVCRIHLVRNDDVIEAWHIILIAKHWTCTVHVNFHL